MVDYGFTVFAESGDCGIEVVEWRGFVCWMAVDGDRIVDGGSLDGDQAGDSACAVIHLLPED